MSYIPKYILKRMLPKNCVSIDGDTIVVAMVNVISPIAIDEVPENPLDYIELKIDDKPVEDLSGLKLKWGEKELNVANFADAIGETLAVGDKLTILIPNAAGVKSGEKHDFEVSIKTDNPINIKFNREVQ